MAGPVLYFVRHGETDWNAEGRLQGGRDTDLNALGRVQAEAAARTLRSLVRGDLARLDFVASPMRRTRDTMEILRGTLGLPRDAYRLDERLVEISFGSWEGSTWPEIRDRDPAGAAAREADKWGFVPPQGESYAMLARRLAPVVEGLVRDTVMVAHGGVARALLTLMADAATERAPHFDIWQGRVLVIQDGAWRWV
ncbi:histidine phosphatase family protein [Salinarimonas ramus]|uniref:Phosphoglycerate mutase n=1 Tax=Salinarimonas ramus TaxID=690164 RepID=A0A917Q6J9_9HYPH|nr:histidine phosphatase family protein [Salinarimonas ramus]GGK30716.1 phosphoglycerate mutase [Salinarimonas ramus]